MSRAALKHLLTRQAGARGLLAAVTDALGTSVCIEDHEGRALHGDPVPAEATRVPVRADGAPAGVVRASTGAASIAAILEYLLARETERKAMGSEVLGLYREINLIYAFSEKLAALLDVSAVASLTLHEARHLIACTDGALLLVADDGERLVAAATFGDAPSLGELRVGSGIIGSIAEKQHAEIIGFVPADPRAIHEETAVGSLMCAPLKVGERVLGVIAIGSFKPTNYTAGELKLLNTLALQAATAIENARLFERTVQAAQERERLLALKREAEVARAKLESEFDLAARIQADLFPKELPALPGYELAARNRPARQCGGDYYDALTLARDGDGPLVLVCVADVSGKGMPAALLMSNTQATLRALAGRAADLSSLVEQVSGLLFASTPANKYVTAAFLLFDPATGRGTFVSAGHVDGLVQRAAGGLHRLESTGAPLGLMGPGIPFEETLVALEPGDTLVLYSDGVPDAQNEAGDEFTDARLCDVLSDGPGASADGLITETFDRVDAFVGGAPQFDDITMLVLRRLTLPVALS